jgi:hypothetical protein
LRLVRMTGVSHLLGEIEHAYHRSER